MELDDLKPAWQLLDARIDHALDRYFARERLRRKAMLRLWTLKAALLAQAAIGLALMLWAAPYWVERIGRIGPMLSGLALHAYGLLMLLVAARELGLVFAIDFAAPVVEIQKTLVRVRGWRIRAALWLGLPHWVLWIAVAVVGFDALAGVDLVAAAPRFVARSLAVGVVGVALTLAFVRWARQRPRLGKPLEDSAVGSTLTRAEALLDDIARFEKE